ncbi:putative RNA methyltransferase [Agromyces kandeliae]|uniref:Methyltransferase domain-containing protein n=1 Tax=Agromyces kandeliae TaxID=2666141 RepID=A0A6L5QXN1_9MICO|nr:methyltransferase domain-containing protein [Agromyces kandeliae]MRX42550.1 methyltransferase domain-containing protein [Agromyces kandeliae]
MSIDSTWLRCPNCFSALDEIADRIHGCENGHRFDRSKYGYLTLLPPRAPRTVGDDRAMLTARAAVLDGGTYAPIAAELVSAVTEDRAANELPQRLRVADLGCGTGYYSARVCDEIRGVDLLLADRSPDAVRMALRAAPAATGVVLDIWRALPIRDASVDVILDVFAPRNAPEFARILRRGGRVIVVVPTARHLRELRANGLLLDIPPEKDAAVSEQLTSAGFDLAARRRVEYRVEVDAGLRALLAGMGPSAHHVAALASADGDAAVRSVTVSVDVLVFELIDS